MLRGSFRQLARATGKCGGGGIVYQEAFTSFVQSAPTQPDAPPKDGWMDQVRAGFKKLLSPADRPHMGQVWFGVQSAVTVIGDKEGVDSVFGGFENVVLQEVLKDNQLVTELVGCICKDVRTKRISPTMAMTILYEANVQLHFLIDRCMANGNETELTALHKSERLVLGTLVTMRALESNSVTQACTAVIGLHNALKSQQQQLAAIRSKGGVSFTAPTVAPPLHHTEWAPVLNFLGSEMPPHETEIVKQTIAQVEGTEVYLCPGRFTMDNAQKAKFFFRIVVPHCAFALTLLPSRLSPEQRNMALLVVVFCGALIAYTLFLKDQSVASIVEKLTANSAAAPASTPPAEKETATSPTSLTKEDLPTLGRSDLDKAPQKSTTIGTSVSLSSLSKLADDDK